MMALAGVELETHVSEPDALTTRPTPCTYQIRASFINQKKKKIVKIITKIYDCPSESSQA